MRKRRARIALVSQSGLMRRGWVSEFARDGSANLDLVADARDGRDGGALAPDTPADGERLQSTSSLPDGDAADVAATAADTDESARPPLFAVGSTVYLPRSRGEREGP